MLIESLPTVNTVVQLQASTYVNAVEIGKCMSKRFHCIVLRKLRHRKGRKTPGTSLCHAIKRFQTMTIAYDSSRHKSCVMVLKIQNETSRNSV